MAGGQSASRRANVPNSIGDWMRQRNEDIRRLGAEADAKGREVWNTATRTGENLAAKTPSDVAAMGARMLAQRQAPAAHPGAPARPPITIPRHALEDARDQVLAGARGAGDSLPFSIADRGSAAVKAALDARHGADFGKAYTRRMAEERASDQYDSAHYGAARMVGQVAGTAAQIAALGPAEGLLTGGVRMAEATPLLARELGVLGGVGGATGVAGQVVSDRASHRQGTLGDYAGAALGGAVGSLASTRGRGGLAGAAAGATTSVAQDLFNGRAPSFDRAQQAAVDGGALGLGGGVAGRAVSNRVPMKVKEGLGEMASRIRTMARGDSTTFEGKFAQRLPGGGYTIPDQRTYLGEVVESKFGRAASLSKRQRQAYAELPNYRVDHSLPRDVGVAFGFPLAQGAMHDGLQRRD